METKKLKELYNQYLLTDIISFYKFKKSNERSYKRYCEFWKNNKYYNETKPPYNFLEFTSKSVHWNNLYGVHDSILKDMQEFYKKENINYLK